MSWGWPQFRLRESTIYRAWEKHRDRLVEEHEYFSRLRLASRAASRTVCRRGDRRVGPVGDGEELSWQRVGQLSSSVIVGPVGLRLHDGGVFEPQAGTSDLRFGSVPLHRRERSSRPRHHRNVSTSLSQGKRYLSIFLF